MNITTALMIHTTLASVLANETALIGTDQELIRVCKAATPAAVTIDEVRRVKVKSISGTGRVRSFVMRAYGAEKQQVTVLCEINARTHGVISIKQRD